MARPPRSWVDWNISPCSWQARSQVGWRDAVASIAKTRRPRRPEAGRACGRLSTRLRKAATAAVAGLSGRFLMAANGARARRDRQCPMRDRIAPRALVTPRAPPLPHGARPPALPMVAGLDGECAMRWVRGAVLALGVAGGGGGGAGGTPPPRPPA